MKQATQTHRRLRLKPKEDNYADLLFFSSRAEADRLLELAAASHECLEYFALMQAPAEGPHDSAALVFERVKTREK